jgi:alkaline phosphatase
VVENDDEGLPLEDPQPDLLGRPYTTLGYANGPGYTGAHSGQSEGAKRYMGYASSVKGIRKGRPDLSKVDTEDPDFLQEATVPRQSETHSGEDVPVYATGPGAELFHGVQEQSYVYHAIVAALGWNAPDPDAAGETGGDTP